MNKRSSKLIKKALMLILTAILMAGTVGAASVMAADSTAKNGYVKEGGKKIYYKNGKKLTGVAKIDDDYYYFEKGVKYTGKKRIKGYWYYFKPKSGKMAINEVVKGVPTNSGAKKTCGYDKKGHAVYGKKTVSGHTYYFARQTGAMRTGWITIGKNRYYFSPKTGRMVTGVKTIKGTKYQFSTKGALQLGNPDINKKAQSYSSPTKYLIVVNRGLRKVSIYQGKKDAWKCIKYWPCCVGAAATPTPVGVFRITGIRGTYFTSGSGNWWWFTNFTGSYHFHSQGYSTAETAAPRTCVAPNMSQAVSHGCIRMYLDNAKYIHDRMPTGTTVVVYN